MKISETLGKTGTIGVLILAVLSSVNSARGDGGLDFFERKIRPLLAEHCYKCHSKEAKKLKANLRLDTRSGWETGGDSGPAIVPGSPETSLFLRAVGYEDEALQMPPKYRLKKQELSDLRQWIKVGAPDPREAQGADGGDKDKIDIIEGRKFWAFRPPRKHPVPQLKDTEWANSDIDRFILAKLEHEEIAPAADADKRTLIRRAFFDLIGLPPSPDDLRAFLEDNSPDAFARIVDVLLSRPEFGERWGRHWLDVARFAESSGGGRSLMFPHAWRFRDYVIKAFNEDKPFNRLIKEHLAGDLLDWKTKEDRNQLLVASGYLVLGVINYELQDKELLRMEVIDEQVDAVGRAFLGMTLSCARCHDHKFDPIPTTDYYALAGIFGGTQSLTPGNVSNYVMRKLDVPVPSEVEAYRKQLAAAESDLKIARGELKTLGRGDPLPKGLISPNSLPGVVIDNSQAKLVGNWVESQSVRGWIGEDYIHDSEEGKGEKRVEYEAKLPAAGRYEVRVSYTASANRSPNAPITVHSSKGQKTVRIDQRKVPPMIGSFVSIGKFSFDEDATARVVIANHGSAGVVIADAVQFLPDSPKKIAEAKQIKPETERKEGKEKAAIREKRMAAKSRVTELDKRVKELKKKAPKYQDAIAMSVKEEAEPRDGHVHIRGGVRNKGQVVPRGFISVALPPDSTARADIQEGESGRLQLAEWIASPSNPLTARVMVNRVWKHLMGKGIVRTTDNFGKTGERPSHPELLDFLALEFVGNGWSVKSMIRRIMLSRSYQLSSETASKDKDPENRLFARAHRKRLEAECIRDAMLVASGQLDERRGGLTIRKISQYDLGYSFDTNRRSVYVPWFRNSVLDIFEVFDVANPNLVVGRRTVTNLPTQALYLMNSPFVRTQAEHAAARLITEGTSLDQVYELILGRSPSDEERKSTQEFLSRFEKSAKTEGWTQVCHALFASVDFRFVN